MKTPILTTALLVVTGALLTSCVGYNSTLFMTKSNFGIDADLKPPTLEVSLARREAVIAPTFDDAKTPPVAASFRVEPGLHVPFFPRISSTFAGGDAADLMSWLFDEPDNMTVSRSSAIPLKSEPRHDFLGFIPMRPQKPGDMQPLLFGTDTTVGLKAAWSGVAAAFPDTVKLGVNRKEFALAPVVMTMTVSNSVTNYYVGSPSFLATMDNQVSVTYITNLNIKHLQYFATGTAAENFARRQAVREAMVRRLDPMAADASFAKSKASASARIRILNAVVMYLDSVEDSRAKPAVAEAQSALAALVSAEQPVRLYRWSTPQSVVRVIDYFPTNGATGANKLVNFWAALTTSTRTLNEIAALPNMNSLKRKDTTDAERAFTAAELVTLKDDLKAVSKRLEHLNERFVALPEVQKMMSVFAALTVSPKQVSP
jgi:hypothetical protein